jgi:hypothetical protein
MPTMGDAPVPEDIVWKDITDDQVAFLKRNFSQEAPNEGLIVSFKETPQLNGLTTLVIHFERQGGGAAAQAVVPAPPQGGEPASPAVGSAQGVLAWGARVTAAFRNKVQAIASELGTDPNFLMAAMAFETGRSFSPSQRNQAGSGAVGLIQFMPRTAEGLGTSSAALAAMSAVDQLDFVQKYLVPFRGKLHSLSDLYMAILFPVAVPKPDDFVLFSMNINPVAFRQNEGLDVNGDGKITKLEASSRVQAMLTEGLRPGNIG